MTFGTDLGRCELDCIPNQVSDKLTKPTAFAMTSAIFAAGIKWFPQVQHTLCTFGVPWLLLDEDILIKMCQGGWRWRWTGAIKLCCIVFMLIITVDDVPVSIYSQDTLYDHGGFRHAGHIKVIIIVIWVWWWWSNAEGNRRWLSECLWWTSCKVWWSRYPRWKLLTIGV